MQPSQPTAVTSVTIATMWDANYCKYCNYVGFVTICNYCEYFANGGILGVASLPAAFWNAGFTHTFFKTTDYRSIGCDSKPIKIIDHGGVCIQSAWIPKTIVHLNCKGRYNKDTTIGYANAIQCV